MTTAMVVPNATAFEKKALAILKTARSIKVSSDKEFQSAGEFLKTLKSYGKELDETFNPSIKAAKAAHSAALDAKKKLAEPIEQAEQIVKEVLAEYNQLMQDKADEEQRKRDLEAQKQADKDRKAKAKESEKAGDHEGAQAILAAPAMPVPVAAPVVEPPKVEGVTFKKRWNAEVSSLSALINAVANGAAPQSLLKVDETALRAFASATQGNMSVAGVRFYSTNEVASRAA